MTNDELAAFLNTTFVCESPKTGTTFNAKPADLPVVSLAYLFQYAVTQMNDAHASETKAKHTVDGVFNEVTWKIDSDTALKDRWDDIYAGTPPGSRAKRPAVDPKIRLVSNMSKTDSHVADMIEALASGDPLRIAQAAGALQKAQKSKAA